MSKIHAKDRSPLLQAIRGKMARAEGWSRSELIGLESSWGPSANPKEFVDDLIRDGDLVECGTDIFGRITYRAKSKDSQ